MSKAFWVSAVFVIQITAAVAASGNQSKASTKRASTSAQAPPIQYSQATQSWPNIPAEGSMLAEDRFTGAVTLQIPIQLPVGRKGLGPELALSYRSSYSNDWVGIGWNLTLGSVQRNPKFGLDFAADDYVLSMPTGSSEIIAVAPGKYKRKEEGDFSRILKIESDSGTHWEITSRNGVRYFFGSTTASRMSDPSDPSRVRSWQLDRLVDTDGNYISFNYIRDEAELYIREILFVGHDAQAPDRRVLFSLEDRPDVSVSYADGFRTVSRKRLHSVTVFARDQVYGALRLEYASNAASGQSLLTSVQRFGADAKIDSGGNILSGTAAPKQSFGWQQTRSLKINDFQSNPIDPGFLEGRAFVDSNGDGRADYCRVTGGGNNFHVQCLLSTGSGFGEEVVSPVVDPGFKDSRFWADLNGDGRSDYCRLVGGNPFRVKCLLSGGTSFGQEILSEPIDPGFPEGRAVVDFNGDSNADYCRVTGGENNFHVQCLLSTGNGFGQEAVSPVIDPGFKDSRFWADVNGDGRADFCRLVGGNPFRLKCLLSAGSNFGKELLSGPIDPGFTEGRAFVDSNGDGKADYCRVTGGGNNFHVQCLLSTGSGFGEEIVSGVTDPGFKDGRFWTDVNGDGRADYCRLVGGNPFRVSCLLSAGPTFGQELMSNPTDPGFPEGRSFADASGDGMGDYCRLVGGAPFRVSCLSGSQERPGFVVSIQNELGGHVDVTYAPSSSTTESLIPFSFPVIKTLAHDDGRGNREQNEYHFEGGFFNFAAREFRGFQKASETRHTNLPLAEQLTIETSFHQGDGVDPQKDDPRVFFASTRGKPFQIEAFSQGKKMFGTTTTYQKDTASRPPFFSPPIRIELQECGLKGCHLHHTSSYTYDALGNTTEERSVSHGGLEQGEVLVTQRTFAYDLEQWLIALMTKEPQLDAVTSQVLSKKELVYDTSESCGVTKGDPSSVPAARGHITRIEAENGSSERSIQRLKYDGYGNLICNKGPQGSETQFIYDESGTYKIEVLNQLGQKAESFYNGVNSAQSSGPFGTLNRNIDVNGGSTGYVYDSLGRTTKRSLPNGAATNTDYLDLGDPLHQRLHTTSDLGILQTVFFDGTGRILSTESSGAEKSILVSANQYGGNGAIARVSSSFFKGEAPLWSSVFYDQIGRVNKLINTDGTTSRICYDGDITVFENADGELVRKKIDGFGRLKSSEQFLTTGKCEDLLNGTVKPYSGIIYGYDAKGRVVKASDLDGHSFVAEYDLGGRLVRTVDPSLGAWHYSYDVAGRLIAQTDARKVTTIFHYDALDRPTSKTTKTGAVESHEVDYFYDEPDRSHGIGQLTRVKDRSGATTYDYDSVGNIEVTTKKIGRHQYTAISKLDTAGRLTYVQYPDSSDAITYAYDGPFLSKVSDSRRVYVTYEKHDAYGRPRTVLFGNGVKTEYGFYGSTDQRCKELTIRLCTIETVGTDGTVLSAARYRYDPVGNVAGLFTESAEYAYAYDGLNRLTSEEVTASESQNTAIAQRELFSAAGNTARMGFANPTSANSPKAIQRATKRFEYDSIGNLLSMPGLGRFTYGSPSPYAPSSAGSLRFEYDQNGNMVKRDRKKLTFDSENRLTDVRGGLTRIHYKYDFRNDRIQRSGWFHRADYVGDAFECETEYFLHKECSKNIYANGQLIARIESQKHVLYFHLDHIRSTLCVTNEKGALVARMEFEPFGEETHPKHPSLNPRYAGLYYDKGTRLYYAKARFYDPAIGKFISPDLIAPIPGDAQFLNRYAYTGNNPITLMDPDGHLAWFVPIIAGAVVGAVQAHVRGDNVLRGRPLAQCLELFQPVQGP